VQSHGEATERSLQSVSSHRSPACRGEEIERRLVTADEIRNPQNLYFRISVNGSVRQSSNTQLMIMNLARQISWASSFYTLYPGDILMSGTCEGVGQVRPGDIMECEIESIGSMTVPVS